MAETEQAQIKRLMNQVRDSLANRADKVAREHKKVWKDRIHTKIGQLSAGALQSRKQQIADQFQPKYRKVVRDVMRKASARARNITIDFHDFLEGMGKVDPNAVTNQNLEQALKVSINELADELLSRHQGRFEEQSTENAIQTPDGSDAEQRSLDRLADSTLRSWAENANTVAINHGRDSTITEYVERTGATVKATRNEVLDENTCGPCEDLDGTTYVVGSDNHQRNLPPAKCEGGHLCRGYMTYTEEGGGQQMAATGELASQWIQILPWGTLSHPDGDIHIDRDFAADLLSAFQHLESCCDYHPPVLSQHRHSGMRYGEVVDLRAQPGRGIYARVQWAEAVVDAIERGLVDTVSPALLYEYEVGDTGRVLPVVLQELSIVSDPHIKGLPTLTEQYELQTPPEEAITMTVEAESVDTDQMEGDHDREMGDETEYQDEPVEDDEMADEYSIGDVMEKVGELSSKLDRLMDQIGGGGPQMSSQGDPQTMQSGPMSPPKGVQKYASKALSEAKEREIEISAEDELVATRLAAGKAPGDVDAYVSTVRELASADEAMYEPDGTKTEHGLRFCMYGGPPAPRYAQKLSEGATDAPETEGGDVQAEGSQMSAVRRQVAGAANDLQDRGLEITDDRLQRLCEARQVDQSLYSDVLEMIDEASAASGGGTNRQSAPGDPDVTEDTPRGVVMSAKDEGVPIGKQLIQYVEDRGVDWSDASKHVDDIYPQD